jgi:hypothetical protein
VKLVAALVNAIQPGMLDRNVVSNCPSQLPSIEMLQRPLESTLNAAIGMMNQADARPLH